MEAEKINQRNKDAPVELIILSFNSCPVSQQFLEALYKNDFEFSVTWVDNNSTDNTRDYLKDFADTHENINLVFSDKNLGVIGGRNTGYEYALENPNLKYICYLDNDQIVGPDFLNQHYSVLKMGYDLIGVESWQMNSSFIPIKKNTSVNDWYCYVGCGGMLMKKELPEGLGEMFSAKFFAFYEDPWLNFKAHFAGYKIGWNYKADLVHLGHQTLGNMANRSQLFQESYLKFLQEWRGTPLPHIKMQEISD